MFLKVVLRPRRLQARCLNTVGAQNVSKQEVPHEKALMWVSYFSHLAEPSNVTVIDGTLLEQDELDVLAREEEGTSDARAITAASKRTLVYGILETFLTTFSKSPGETTWHLGKRQYDLDQIKEFYEGKMKDREMYVIPYYNTWSDSYGIRISDSAYMTLINMGLQSKIGHPVWAEMENASDIEVVIHATQASILPDDQPTININLTAKGKATVDQKIAELNEKNDFKLRE